MSGLLPEVDGWIKLAGAFVAILMAVLVPVRSWMVEDRRYRAQTLAALSSSSRSTLAGVATSSNAFADTLAIARLTESLSRVAGAIERLTEQEADRDKDRLTRALERFLVNQGEDPRMLGRPINAPASPPARDPPAR